MMPKVKGREERFPMSWSYSSWSQMKKCEFAWYCKFVLGIKDTSSSPALQHGIMQHSKAEGYLKGTVTSLPKSFGIFTAHYAAMKKLKPIVEKFWGVSQEWKPMEWRSWVVMKMDAAVLPCKKTDNLLIVQDLKTGKEYPGHKDQSDLYAAISFSRFPKVEGIESEFWYVDSNHAVTYSYDRADLKEQKEIWIERGEKLLTPKKRYMPNPTPDNCKWCSLRTDKGGPCDAWKRT